MTHNAFAAVLALSPLEQRRLLQEGDSPERLWASWAIALAIGADAIPLLEPAALLDKPPGLRRQLLVVLAGLQERELLRAVALHDPSSEVRATACAYFVRTAPSITDADTLAFAQSLLISGTADIREALLLEHDSGRLALPHEVVLSLLGDVEPALRILALGSVRRVPNPTAATIDSLVRRLVDEPDEAIARSLFAAIPRSAYARLFEGLASSPTDPTARLARALGLVKECHGSLDWSEVAPLAQRTERVVLAHVLNLLQAPLPEEAFRWVVQWYKRLSASEGNEAGSRFGVEHARSRSLDLIESSLSPETVGLLDSEAIALVERGLEARAVDLAELQGDWSDDDGGLASSLLQARESLVLLRAR